MRALCGEGSFASLIIATTGWNRLKADDQPTHYELANEKRLLTNEVFEQVIEAGAKQFRFCRDHSSAMHIVDTLLAREHKFKLQVQYEVLE